MGRLIKYELKKQQISRNIILALLLVFLLAVVVGTFTENGNTVGISVMLEMFVGMFDGHFVRKNGRKFEICRLVEGQDEVIVTVDQRRDGHLIVVRNLDFFYDELQVVL